MTGSSTLPGWRHPARSDCFCEIRSRRRLRDPVVTAPTSTRIRHQETLPDEDHPGIIHQLLDAAMMPPQNAYWI